MMRPLYCGIDPGIRQGKCVLAITTGSAVLEPRFVQLGSNSWQAKGVVSDYVRTSKISTELIRVLKTYPLGRGSVVAVEGPSFGRFAARTVQVGLLHFAIYQALSHFQGLGVATVSPTVLKKFVTNRGKASKADMIAAVQERWAEDLPELSEDMYEALALAKAADALSCPTTIQLETLSGKVLMHRVERGGEYYLATKLG